LRLFERLLMTEAANQMTSKTPATNDSEQQ
jgi:hypothetical protein